MKTMTIRNIPDGVAEVLHERAKESGRSMNATVVAVLTDAFGGGEKAKPRHDFSEFCGVWSREEAEAFDRETACFEEIHPEDWA